jgi:hypothetical protein
MSILLVYDVDAVYSSMVLFELNMLNKVDILSKYSSFLKLLINPSVLLKNIGKTNNRRDFEISFFL